METEELCSLCGTDETQIKSADLLIVEAGGAYSYH
jgi:hypothetical protein